MKKKITISDVAKEANVSKSTVSQFLNGRYEYMGLPVRKRVEETIKRLNYHPNAVARSLKTKSTSTIGIIVANILHTYSTQVIKSIEDVCHEEGISTIICNADNDPEKELKYINILLAKQVDGLVLIPMKENAEEYNRLINQGYPIVFLDRIIENVDNESIILDNEYATELAVNHLLDRNYKKISIITTPLKENITPRTERVLGYKKALEKRNVLVNQEYIKSVTLPEMEIELNKMFSSNNPPDAIISGNDLTLVEILNFIKKNNLKLGEKVGLVTIDEVPFTSLFTPSITTIQQPTSIMGEKAAQILLNKINKKTDNLISKSKVYRFKPELIVRNSS